MPIPPPNDVPVSASEVVVSVGIGVGSWLLRCLITPERSTWGYRLRHTVTSGSAALIVGVAIKQYYASEWLAFAASGIVASHAPEILDAGLGWLRKQGK